MTLSQYHQKYTNQSDTEIQNRTNEKKLELSEIFKEVQLKTSDEFVRVAVLGCGDKRYVGKHKEIFEGLLERPVEITTFDIVVDHLQGEENVMQHDCTLALPKSPFDITYALSLIHI